MTEPVALALSEFTWTPGADPAAVADVAARLELAGLPVQRQRALGPLTTFGVGGPAEVFVEVADEARLQAVMTLLAATTAAQVPLLVVGRGSNLLVADAGFPGVALRLGRGFSGISRDGELVRAGGATAMPQLAAWSARAGLAGIEFAAAIPASVGGSVRMNAGAHGADMASVLVSARLSGPAQPAPRILPVGELGLSYRHSALPERAVVTGATLRLRADDPAAVRERLAGHREWRRRTQPLRARSCGSTFTNPPGGSAGRLIEAAGGKQLSVGGARVSEKHANFIVVEPGARARDVYLLIERVRGLVLERGGPALVPEVKAVGDFSADPLVGRLSADPLVGRLDGRATPS